jgi:hypothetical protein
MKTKYFFIVFIVIMFFQINTFSQDEGIIEINNTNIEIPEIHDFGTFSTTAMTKYIIKNNRSTPVVVSNIKTPVGFFANISDMNIAPNKKVILYVGLEPSYTEIKGNFEKEIVIETNLIMSIIIKLKGNIISE